MTTKAIASGEATPEDAIARANAIYDVRARKAIEPRKIKQDDEKDLFFVRKRMLNRALRERTADAQTLAQIRGEINALFEAILATLPIDPDKIPAIFASQREMHVADSFIDAKQEELEHINNEKIAKVTEALQAKYRARFDAATTRYEEGLRALEAERNAAHAEIRRGESVTFMNEKDNVAFFAALMESFLPPLVTAVAVTAEIAP